MGQTSTLPKGVRRAEHDYYDKLASTWWDRSGPLWPLHRLNALRVDWIVENLAKLGLGDRGEVNALNGVRILDVGCGGGILSESMAKLGANVHGIDVVDKNIAIAQTHADKQNLTTTYEKTTAEALAEQGLQFDVVLNMEVVEHVENVDDFLTSCCSLVRPGGVMFVATINRTILAALTAIFAAEYVLAWLPRGTHHYNQLVKPEEVNGVLETHNLSTINWTGVGVNPFSRSMYLRKSTAVNYMLCAVK